MNPQAATNLHAARFPSRPSRWVLAVALLLAMTTSCTGSVPGKDAAAASKHGAAGVGDRLFPALGNGGYDVTHYGLTLHYVPETNRLKGTAVITARATQDLSRFNLDLSGLRVRGATVQGAKARYTREKDELLVTPAKPLKHGDAFKTVVTYDGTPRTIEDDDGSVEGWIETDDGSTALGQPSGSMTWFPGNHHPSDKATYDITVTVPKDEDGTGAGGTEGCSTSALGPLLSGTGGSVWSPYAGKPGSRMSATAPAAALSALRNFMVESPDQSRRASRQVA